MTWGLFKLWKRMQNGDDDVVVEIGFGAWKKEREEERFGLRRVVEPRELVTAGVEQLRA